MAHTYGTSARLPATATTTAANPATFTINCPSGTTVLWLGIVVGGTTARAGGNPTYNSVSMTAGAAKTNAGGTPETCAETWYMLSPPTGSALTISVPNSGTLAMTLMAATGAAPAGGTSAKINASVATAGSSTNPSTTGPAGVIGDIAFGRVGNGATTWNPTGRSGTQIYDWDAGSWGGGAQYRIAATDAGETFSWTFGTSEDWIIEVDRFTQASGSLTPTGQASTSGFGKSGTNTFESWTLDKAFDSSQTYSTASQGAIATWELDLTPVGQAGTGETTNPSVESDTAFEGVEGIGELGTLGAETSYGAELSGQESLSSPGTFGVEGNPSLLGAVTSGAIGEASTSFSLELLGQGATSELGALPAEFAIVLGGVEGTGEVGTLTPAIVTDVTLELEGRSSTSFAGFVTATAEYFAELAGVEATGEVGTLLSEVTYGALLVGQYVDGRIGTLATFIAQEAVLQGHEGITGIGEFYSIYRDKGIAWVEGGDAYDEIVLFRRRR